MRNRLLKFSDIYVTFPPENAKPIYLVSLNIVMVIFLTDTITLTQGRLEFYLQPLQYSITAY